MKLLISKRRFLTAAVLILLALFLVRPGVSRLKMRIANSISRAVGRPVEIGSVHIRFLPPGFDLQNLVIDEDPAFGAEPMLRAPEVTATVRFTSLVRGRLDISRLELTEPSLNLVRREDGRWNWESLLERAAHSPLAPTAKAKSETRPGFPYIEASSGRINFKSGPEKKPYALVNADFALWQGSEDAWGVRMRAEPLRTDVNLSDTGNVRMEGTWRRAVSLRETPLRFNLEWDSVQLGQLTKLVWGRDKGWRGAVRLITTLNGMPSALNISADASIQDFHRYDISSSEGLPLAAHCDAIYNSAEVTMRDILCSSPVADGRITMRGNAGLPGVHKVDLLLKLEDVPVSAAAQLARRAKKNLPADLMSAGSIQGDFEVKEDGPGTAEFEGRGEILNLHLRSAITKVEFAPGNIPFVLKSSRAGLPGSLKGNARDAELMPAPDLLHVEFGPFPVALGRPVPAQAHGWVARSGYGLVVRGEGEASRSLRVASLLGLPTSQASVEGALQMDLQIAGSWAGDVSGPATGFSPPQVTGTAQLHNVRASMRGVNGPLEIFSGDLRLMAHETRVEKLRVGAADALWTGSVALPRGCGVPGACLVRFNLNADEVELGSLSKWLASKPSERRWYQVLTSVQPAAQSLLENLRASGKLSAGRLLVHNLVATDLSAFLDLDRGKLSITDLRADLLGGSHVGDWHASFAGGPPVYAGTGTLKGISLQQMAEAMHDPWISGTASGTYQITAAGVDSGTFWQSADVGLQFDVSDGVLSHISLADDEDAMSVAHWEGQARMHGGTIEVEKGNLISPSALYQVSGTVSLGRVLDFKLIRGIDKSAGAGSLVYSVTGTVAEPRVTLTPTPQTQAQLKP